MKNIFLIYIIIFIIIIIYIFFDNLLVKKNKIENFSNNYDEDGFDFDNNDKDTYDKEFVDFYEIIYRDNTDIDYDYKIIENKILKNKNKNIKILVGGSGVGKLCNKFKEKYENVTGIDNSESMILYSKRKYPNIKFIKGNLLIQNILEKNNYDLIILDERTLFHNTFKEQKNIIQNCYLWLNDDGYLIVPIYDPNELQVASRYYSSNYIDDKGNYHGFTYLNDFSHDCYYIKEDKDNKESIEYNFYDKIVLKDGKKRVKKTKLYIPDKENIYDLILKNGFEKIYIEPIHLQILGGYELAFFKKKNIKTTVEKLQK